MPVQFLPWYFPRLTSRSYTWFNFHSILTANPSFSPFSAFKLYFSYSCKVLVDSSLESAENEYSETDNYCQWKSNLEPLHVCTSYFIVVVHPMLPSFRCLRCLIRIRPDYLFILLKLLQLSSLFVTPSNTAIMVHRSRLYLKSHDLLDFLANFVILDLHVKVII